MCLFNTYMSMTLNFNCSVLVFFRNIIQFYFLRIDIILDSTRKSKVSSQLWTVNMQWSWPPSWVMVTLNERAAQPPQAAGADIYWDQILTAHSPLALLC